MAAAAADLTVVSFGGVYAESQRNAYGVPFEQRTGSAIEWVDYNGGLAEIRAQVESSERVLFGLGDLVFAFQAHRRAPLGVLGCAQRSSSGKASWRLADIKSLTHRRSTHADEE